MERILNTFNILCSEPGPPSDIKVYEFAKYILVTWEPPSEPKGVITHYQLGSEDYIDNSDEKDVVVEMQLTGIDERRKLLENQKADTKYVVGIQARTSIGWGTSFRKLARTVKWSGTYFVFCLVHGTSHP